MSLSTPALKPCRILLVEGPDTARSLERAVNAVKTGIGREVVVERAEDGLDAASRISLGDLTNRLPDVLVIDLNTPRVDGVELLRALKRTFPLNGLPVVALTTSMAKPAHDEALGAGADKVFVKPDDAEALLAIAAEVIDRGVLYGQSRN